MYRQPLQHLVKLKKQSKSIIIKDIMLDLSNGNYCFSLVNYYIPTKEQNCFLRYYGDDKINKVKNVVKVNSLKLPDDLLTNLILLLLFQQNGSLDDYKKARKFILLNTNRGLNIKNIKERLIKLYDRYHYEVYLHNTHFYLGHLLTPSKVIQGLSDSHKKLYCNICFTYCCQLHLISKNNFDSAEGYNVKHFLKSYKEINQLSYKLITNNGTTINNSALKNRIEENIDLYNVFIKKKKLTQLSSDLNIYSKKILNLSECNDHTECGRFCYINYLSIKNEIRAIIFNQFIDNPLPHRFELFLSKFVQIYKYNPCDIAKVLKYLQYPSLGKNNFEMSCYLIYLRLQSIDFQINIVLNDSIIETFSNEKYLKNCKNQPHKRLEIIKENIEKSIFILFYFIR